MTSVGFPDVAEGRSFEGYESRTNSRWPTEKCHGKGADDRLSARAKHGKEIQEGMDGLKLKVDQAELHQQRIYISSDPRMIGL